MKLYKNHLSRAFKVFSLILMLLPFFSGYSQTQLSGEKSAVVDSLVNSYMSKNSIPGVSIAIIKNQKIITERGYGMASLENFSPATPSTIYRLASVSKPITAVAVMQLVEKGKLNLDAKVQEYVPEFPEKTYPITIRQLLAHTTGIRHYKGEEFISNKAYGSLTEALEIFKLDSLLHEPGTQQTYSTYGYTILGTVIESASGMLFKNYIEENIFIPAGMDQTFVDDPQQIIPLRSANYDKLPEGSVLNSIPVNTSYKIPGGGLLSNVGDMARFLIGIQNRDLINDVSWNQMTKEVYTNQGEPTHYGFGWILGIPPFPGFPQLPTSVWHGGVQQGSTSVILLIPEEEIGVVILSNSGGFGDDITLTVALIASVVMGKS